MGVRLPDAGVLRPSSPPPDFDLELAIASLHKFADRNPAGVALAHYGLVPAPLDTLAEAEDTLRQWAEVAETAWRNGDDIAAALDQTFSKDLTDIPPEHRKKLETLNGVHSNAAGLRRWLETRDRTSDGDTDRG